MERDNYSSSFLFRITKTTKLTGVIGIPGIISRNTGYLIKRKPKIKFIDFHSLG